MRHSRRFWALALTFALGCGSRTLLNGVEPEGSSGDDGGSGDDGPTGTGDGPISTGDGPTGLPDGVRPPPFEDGISPPPFEGGFQDASEDAFDGASEDVFDGSFDGPIISDGGFPDGISFPPDSGFGDGAAPIFCGTEICVGGQDCCVSLSTSGPTSSCVAPGTCKMGVDLACTGSDNCAAGDVCCASFGGGMGSATCEPMACGPGNIQLCTDDGDCPTGDHCDPTPIGVSVCRRHH
jgi:hypothetical protein